MVILSVYWRRTIFLSTFYDDDDNYLCNERKHYQRIRASTFRRSNMSVSEGRKSMQFISDLNEFMSKRSSMCLFGGNCDVIRQSVLHR